MASIPPAEFETLIESEDVSIPVIDLLARERTNKTTTYERRCPHCDGIEKVSK